jgi:hypothetical protein
MSDRIRTTSESPRGGEDDAYKLWHRLSDEANCYLDGVEDELIGRVKSGTP